MSRKVLIAAAAGGVCSASAFAGIFDPAMYGSPDPSTYGTLIASLDIDDTAYDFPFAASFSSSGFVNVFNGFELDRTDLVSNVYRVTSQTTVMSGGDMLTLNPGDNVYAYTIRLVEASTNTVSTMSEFQVGALDFSGATIGMDETLIRGRGFVTPGSGVQTPLGGNAGDLSAIGNFGSSLDWEWSTDASGQLMNDETITLLMFTTASMPIEGLANFSGPPGQQSVGDPNANGAPALVPTIPGPGAITLLGAAGLCLGSRRRR
ncbi:MAG: hypothetical protein VYC34_01845 [Planctomycetota bacterium]|nr:hypothetical protein [Planctomycetota bacterium]